MGYQHLGIPVGGALDRAAAQRANALVGNPLGSPVLEVTLSGPRLAFSAAAQVAITGADLSPTVNAEVAPLEEAFMVKAGDVLAFGRCRSGCRAYLAIQGRWDVDYWLGSASRAVATVAACTPRARLRKNDVLSVAPLAAAVEAAQSKEKLISIGKAAERLSLPLAVPVRPAPEYALMNRAWRAAFFTHTFTVSGAADRMGCRLAERMRVPAGLSKMLSSGVLPGTVQLTPSGRLIILLADAQTTGGYFRIAQLTHQAQNALAQLKPGDKLHFIRPLA
jgi:biotin-dependent carboxylase-like uncharacterized protein